MESPLAQDKETVKKYKIPAAVELQPIQKLAYLEEQLYQLQAMHWRARVDMLHAKRMQGDDNEILKNKGLQNFAQHLNEVQQTVGGILMVQKMVKELRAEYPNLGKTNAGSE